MKPALVCAAALLLLSAAAAPSVVGRACPACRGRRSLSVTPPNLGQFDGEIGVTPGRPFSTHRWDVRIDHCPLCDGTGRQTLYRTRVRPPKPEDAAGLDVCPDCRWSGVTPCRKCLTTGLLPCPACKSASRGGKPGWIKTERRTPGATSRHVKIVVTPCGTCQGIGKVVCPDCLGKGALPCRKCQGEGGTPRKETR